MMKVKKLFCGKMFDIPQHDFVDRFNLNLRKKRRKKLLKQSKILKIKYKNYTLHAFQNEFGKQFHIKHTLILSMIDGKVCSALTETGVQNCHICHCKPSGMNDFAKADFIGTPESLKYGISVLHANIRCFERIIHLAYGLEVKKWEVRERPMLGTLLAGFLKMPN